MQPIIHVRQEEDTKRCWDCNRVLSISKFHMTKRIKGITTYIYKRRDCVDCRRDKDIEARRLRKEKKKLLDK